MARTRTETRALAVTCDGRVYCKAASSDLDPSTDAPPNADCDWMSPSRALPHHATLLHRLYCCGFLRSTVSDSLCVQASSSSSDLPTTVGRHSSQPLWLIVG